MSCPRLCLHVLHVLTTSPRLPDSGRQQTSFFFFWILSSLLLRNTDQGVETCVQVSWDSGTDGKESCGSLVKAQASARLDVPTAFFFAGRTMYTEYTLTACMTYKTVCSQARPDTECVLVAQELNGSVAFSRSTMSSPCWSLPHLLSSSLPQHAALPGQRDLLQEDTVHQEPLSQEPLLKTSANAIRSESNAKESVSHYESAGNLRPNTPTDQGVQHVCKFLCECLDMCLSGNRFQHQEKGECLDVCAAGNQP